jgi:hypothetical protein
MASLHPSLPPRRALRAGDHAELQVLRTLEDALPGAYTLFHSVDWSDVVGDTVRHGEVDIVIVNQAGDVLQLEVKAGEVEAAPGQITKLYGQARKAVDAQVERQFGAMRDRLDKAMLPVKLAQLLVLPHVRVATGTARWPRERIVDSAEFEGLARRVQAELGPGLHDDDRHRKVLEFFGNVFRVQPDVSALTGRLSDASARLSSGLATWVPRLEVPSGIVRVVGTAGSGKTQLAMHMLREADSAGQRGAYLCFNRALADHMAHVLPVRTSAETFHQMADRLARQAGLAVDYAQPGAFDTLAEHAHTRLTDAEPDLDLLVVDEMQDLKPEWVSALLQRLRPNGRAVLLEDPQQQLYGDREAFAIDGEVTIRSPENYRSPRALVRLVNGLRLTDEPAEALGPYEGELPDPIVCSSGKSAKDWAAATQRAVQRCLDRGFALEDIAVVTLRGRASSVLLEQEALGRWPLRRFTGTYDAQGDPVWTQGVLLIDTVYRFKGQAAHAVVLTECDFAEWSERVRRSLFVGITRARVHLEWVVSEGVGELVAQRLSASADTP